MPKRLGATSIHDLIHEQSVKNLSAVPGSQYRVPTVTLHVFTKQCHCHVVF